MGWGRSTVLLDFRLQSNHAVVSKAGTHARSSNSGEQGLNAAQYDVQRNDAENMCSLEGFILAIVPLGI